jgi:gallate decarboxylase subunit D
MPGDRARISYGHGSREIVLEAEFLGDQVVVFLFNEKPHIGAVALAEYDAETRRSSTSVLTRLAHKDDVVAVRAAYRISKSAKTASCVVAGIHIDNATFEDIVETQRNAAKAVGLFLESGFCGVGVTGS